jgi:hypothetical protein
MRDTNKQITKTCYLPMTEEVVPPGAPTVDKAGPLLPTLETKIIPCLLTASLITSQIRLEAQKSSPHQQYYRNKPT